MTEEEVELHNRILEIENRIKVNEEKIKLIDELIENIKILQSIPSNNDSVE